MSGRFVRAPLPGSMPRSLLKLGPEGRDLFFAIIGLSMERETYGRVTLEAIVSEAQRRDVSKGRALRRIRAMVEAGELIESGTRRERWYRVANYDRYGWRPGLSLVTNGPVHDQESFTDELLGLVIKSPVHDQGLVTNGPVYDHLDENESLKQARNGPRKPLCEIVSDRPHVRAAGAPHPKGGAPSQPPARNTADPSGLEERACEVGQGSPPRPVVEPLGRAHPQPVSGQGGGSAEGEEDELFWDDNDVPWFRSELPTPRARFKSGMWPAMTDETAKALLESPPSEPPSEEREWTVADAEMEASIEDTLENGDVFTNYLEAIVRQWDDRRGPPAITLPPWDGMDAYAAYLPQAMRLLDGEDVVRDAAPPPATPPQAAAEPRGEAPLAGPSADASTDRPSTLAEGAGEWLKLADMFVPPEERARLAAVAEEAARWKASEAARLLELEHDPEMRELARAQDEARRTAVAREAEARRLQAERTKAKETGS